MLQSSSVLKYVDYYSERGIKHIFGFEVCSAYLSDLKTPAHEAHHRLLVFIVFFSLTVLWHPGMKMLFRIIIVLKEILLFASVYGFDLI